MSKKSAVKFFRSQICNASVDAVRSCLAKATVGIAGLGGLGSNAAIALVRAGIGSLILVDFDLVEESNLNRQYYFIDQIGKYKTEALEENIRRISTNVKLDMHATKLAPGNMEKPFLKADVVIEALDLAETKTIFIEEIQTKYPDKPIIAASGVAGLSKLEAIRTLHFGSLQICYNPEAPPSDESMLLAPRVCLMANWEADLAIQIILKNRLLS